MHFPVDCMLWVKEKFTVRDLTKYTWFSSDLFSLGSDFSASAQFRKKKQLCQSPKMAHVRDKEVRMLCQSVTETIWAEYATTDLRDKLPPSIAKSMENPCYPQDNTPPSWNKPPQNPDKPRSSKYQRWVIAAEPIYASTEVLSEWQNKNNFEFSNLR